MKILHEARKQLLSNWYACRLVSGKRSAQYGIRFSYPVFILLVGLSIFFVNPAALLLAVIIALFAIILPMHPLDYVYNFVFARFAGLAKIPGRGTELAVSSSIAAVFSLVVIGLILLGAQINFAIMALIYVASSVFFIVVLLFKDDFSMHSLFGWLIKSDTKP